MYRLPGLSIRATSMVVSAVERQFADWESGVGRPRSLSAVQVLRMTLCRLRRNLTYAELAADCGVSGSTAWAYVQLMVPFLADQFGCTDADLPGLVAGKICLVDGTLVPTVNWRHRTDLYSTHRHRYGMNVQLLVDLHGRIISASRAFPGRWHDMHCFRDAGWPDLITNSGGGIADLGYEGAPELITPVKKPAGAALADADRQFNVRLATIRAAVKGGVAHLKNWRILAHRYRSDLTRINTDIHAVIGLQKLNEQLSGQRLSFHRIIAAGLSE